MSVTVKPPIFPRPVVASPDDVDRLLGAFFRAAMPQPWPAPTLPAAEDRPPLGSGPRLANTAEAPARRAFSLARSRWALAASVLVLVLGHAFLTRAFPSIPPSDANDEPAMTIGTRPNHIHKLPDMSRGGKPLALPSKDHP